MVSSEESKKTRIWGKMEVAMSSKRQPIVTGSDSLTKRKWGYNEAGDRGYMELCMLMQIPSKEIQKDRNTRNTWWQIEAMPGVSCSCAGGLLGYWRQWLLPLWEEKCRPALEAAPTPTLHPLILPDTNTNTNTNTNINTNTSRRNASSRCCSNQQPFLLIVT